MVADFNGGAVHLIVPAFGNAAPNGGMSEDVRTAANVDSFTDLKTALTVDHTESADPSAFTDLGVSDNPGVGIIRIGRKAVVLRYFQSETGAPPFLRDWSAQLKTWTT